MIRVIHSISQIRGYVEDIKRKKRSIGFVPTMGYFHEGHLSLFRKARKETDVVIGSLYVNPTQFAPREDYTQYPMDFKRDLELAKKEKMDILFKPTDRQMYPEGFSTFVVNEPLSKILEGKTRPTHFRGVLTILTKLFHIITPDVAYFGQKDYQQVLVVRRMVKNLNFPLKIKVLPTVREEDGLAMSSRNVYLEGDARTRALILFSALQQGRDMVSLGIRSSTVILKVLRRKIRKTHGVRLDYLEMVDAETLEKIKTIRKKVLFIGAIWVGKIRLIDNLWV